ISCAQQSPASSAGSSDGEAAISIQGGTAPYTIEYSGPSSGNDNAATEGTYNFGGLEVGTYTFTVTDDNGCVETCSVVIDVLGGVVCNRLQDSLALVDLYNATDGPNWTNSWDLDQPMETWFGLVFTAEGCVEEIALGVNNLLGTLPASLGTLSQIQRLYLFENELSGNLPAELGNAATLQQIFIYSNQFDGNLPAQWSSLINLEGLSLFNNNLSGVIPEEWGSLQSLLELYLNSNQLSGNIPVSFIGLASLEILHIDNNRLDALLPSLPIGIQDMRIQGNRLVFRDLLPEAAALLAIPNIVYAPQAEVLSFQEITVVEGTNVMINDSYPSPDPSNDYEWFREGISYLTASGGNIPPLNFPAITLGDAGTYQLEITNANLPDLTLFSQLKIINVEAEVDCTDSDLTFAFGDLQGPSCGLADNGFAGLVPFLGVPPYSYLWSNGDTSPIATNLSEGQYGFTITDAEGCTVDGQVNLMAINPIELICPDDIDIIIEADENGILLDIPLPDTGICPADSVRHFAEGATLIPDALGAVGVQFFNVGVTTVTYYVPGLDSCTFNVNVSQVEDPCDDFAVTPNQVQSPICNDGNDGFIELTVSGGDGNYEFTWSNGAITEDLTDLSVGLYVATITDGSGCEVSVSFWLQEESELNLSCEGIPFSNYGQMNSSIQLFASGGQAPYNIDFVGPVSGALPDQLEGEIFLDDLPEGDYVITLTDADGCMITCATSITDPCTTFVCPDDITLFIEADSSGILLDIPGPDVGDCGLGFIQYNLQGATVQGNTAGVVGIQFFNVGVTTVNYFVPGKDTCTFNVEILKVSDPCDDFAIIPNQVESPLCEGDANGTIELTVIGGDGNYTYDWSNGASSEDLENLALGLYLLTIIDGNGCEVSTSFWLQGPNSINLVCDHLPGSGILSFDLSGGTGPYNVDVTGPENFTFSDINEGFYEVEDIPAGDYNITVIDANGCTVFCDVMVVDEVNCDDLGFSFTVENSNCLLADGSANVMVFGGSDDYAYVWSNGTTNPMLINVFAGTYGLTITDNINGCILTTDITIPNVGEAQQLAIEETICIGESYLFDGVELTEPDIYTAILVNQFGCDSIVTLTLNVVELTTEIMGDPTYCEDEIGAHRFEVDWDGEVLWSTGSTEDFVDVLLTDGTLSVSITDENGCMAVDEIDLSIIPSPEVEITGVLEVCKDELTEVVASGGVNYEWSTGEFGPVVMLPSGTHAVSVTNAEGCVTVELVEIIENELPILPIYDPIATICFGIIPELSINNPLPDFIIDWFNENNQFLGSGNTFQPQGPGNYFAQMRNTLTGCVSIELAMFQVFPDTEPPVFENCPSDDEIFVVVWNTAEDVGPTINDPAFVATDNCSDVDILTQIVDTAPVGQEGCGPIVVTGWATDASGNTSMCSYEIEVVKTDDLTFFIDTANIDFEDNVFDVSVLAKDFNNVSGFQFTMMISDTSGGTFLGLTPLAPELEDGLSFNIQNDSTMRILWSEVSSNPNQLSVSLPDSTPIFSLQLSMPGEPGDCDMLMFADDPVNKVAIRDNVGEVIPGTIDGEVCIPEIASITGRIHREDDQGVKNVEVNLISNEGTLTAITDTDGNYFFNELPLGMDYTIVPFKDDNHPNGLSLVDITRIRDYILFGPQSQFLETPYRKISADATNNTNISLTDLTTLIVLRISGPDAVLPNNTSWRFVDADHEFQNPDIPWLGGFPEEKFIASLNEDSTDNDFIAMKIGDVNLTAATQLFPSTPHYLELADQELVEGQTVLVPINAKHINNLIGFELDLVFDPTVMKLEQIIPGDLPMSDFRFNEDRFREGVLSGLWLNMFGEDFGAEEMTMFYLEFTAKEDGQLSELLGLGYEYMESIGVTNDHRAVPLELVFTDQAIISSTNQVDRPEMQLMGAYPNPFDESTNIQFFLPEAENVQIELYDLSGKVHWVESRDLSSGYQEWLIGDQELSTEGIYFYRLSANGREVYGKLIKQ
ncbi:MAG: T9SS type A sorting domain-containing protein, partial [Saprospiraceae bacterium]|nr:T9SS type A sorting domain-containing protein [Saprospiraceae bacterium]